MEELKQIIEALKVTQTNLKALAQQMAEDSAKAKQLKEEYQRRVADLDPREKWILSREKSLHSADELHKWRVSLEAQVAEIENQRKECDRECSARRATLDELEAQAREKAKELDAGRARLEEEKETYKQTLLRKMGAEQCS